MSAAKLLLQSSSLHLLIAMGPTAGARVALLCCMADHPSYIFLLAMLFNL